ncbi:hypothetical protein AAVH_30007 [Aphelenchoides avenae]|nr:hypothetical protein AAVH_30007 [Aphelenchus avenae]
MAATEAAYYIELEESYRTAMIIAIIVNILQLGPSMIVIWRYTPKEMSSFRYTVTNCTVWLFLSVLFFTFVFRPIVISPLSIAAVTGFFPTQYALCIGLTLYMNVSVSFTLCLGTQYTTVAFPMLFRRLDIRHGIAVFVSCHVTMSLVCFGVVTYSTSTNAPEDALRLFVQQEFHELSYYVKDRKLIGSLPDSGSTLVTPCIVVWLSCLASVWIFMLVSTLRTVVFKKTSDERTRHIRRTVGLTLTARTVIPLLTLTIPAVSGSLFMWTRATDVGGVIAGFMIFSSLTGPLMAVSLTLFVKSYKEGLKKMLRLGEIKRMLGLSESETTTTANTKGGSDDDEVEQNQALNL